jgi:hypothetical protein
VQGLPLGWCQGDDQRRNLSRVWYTADLEPATSAANGSLTRVAYAKQSIVLKKRRHGRLAIPACNYFTCGLAYGSHTAGEHLPLRPEVPAVVSACPAPQPDVCGI